MVLYLLLQPNLCYCRRRRLRGCGVWALVDLGGLGTGQPCACFDPPKQNLHTWNYPETPELEILWKYFENGDAC